MCKHCNYHYAHAELEIDGDGKCLFPILGVPVGSGLGTTGAVNVALMAVIKGKDGCEELAYQFNYLEITAGVKTSELQGMVESNISVRWKRC